MASATITGLSVCDGGEHVTLRTSINGGSAFNESFTVTELRQPISADERRTAVSVMARFHCQNMTKAQAWADLVAGVDVVTGTQ